MKLNHQHVLYDNRKKGRITRFAIQFFCACMVMLFAEMARAGLTVRSSGYTPELFNAIPTTPVSQEQSVFLLISAVILGALSLLFLVKSFFYGQIVLLTADKENIYQHWNGFSGKVKAFKKKRISRIRQIQLRKNDSSNMSGRSVKVTFSYANSKGQKKKVVLLSDHISKVKPVLANFKEALGHI